MAICLVCGRRVNVTRRGILRRHTRARGDVCPGSWQSPAQSDTPASVERKMAQAVGIAERFYQYFGTSEEEQP